MTIKCNDAVSLTLVFSFFIDNAERESILYTNIDRENEIVCFSIPFKLELAIQNAELIKVEQQINSFVYIFEFETLNHAIKWMKIRKVRVDQPNKTGKVYEIQTEMNKFMQEYDERKNIKKKKTKIVDEDGFTAFL